MQTNIVFFGKQVTLSCDADCEHAWGINWIGPRGETAPVDPGTYEGNDAKPPDKTHNKWCARECERSEVSELTIEG